MISNRMCILAAGTCLSLAACGDSGGSSPDAAITPTGMHYGYVVSSVTLPPNRMQAATNQYGIDLGKRTANTADGVIDNVLGESLATLAGPGFGFPIQATITEAVDQGAILLLVDLQTTDFANAGASGIGIKLGATPQPPACSSDTDMTCRHHLDGNASFSVASNSPANAALAGQIVNGTLNAGPGNLTLQIALGSTEPITLNLVNARVRATAVSATAVTAVLGGLLLSQEVTDRVVPAVYAQLGPILLRDCGPEAERSGPTCNCSSTGATIMTVFDKAPEDCKVSLTEVQDSDVVAQLLERDVCSKATCTDADAVSIGVKIEAVKATFPGLQ